MAGSQKYVQLQTQGHEQRQEYEPALALTLCIQRYMQSLTEGLATLLKAHIRQQLLEGELQLLIRVNDYLCHKIFCIKGE